MPLLTLLLVIAWTLVVFRLLCFRKTLGARTLVTLLALGSAAGPFAVAVAEKFFNSYAWQGTYYFWCIEVARQFMLVSPVLVLIMGREWRWGASVADAFVAAFVVGFGYDVIGPLLVTVPRDHIDIAFSFLPPGVVSLPSITVAGYGYWCGFAALAFAVGLRFGRSRIAGFVTGIVALMAGGADSYFDFAALPRSRQRWLKS